MLFVSELPPYVHGTGQVDLEDPSGLLTSVSAGLSAPDITLVWPNGGELLDGGTVNVWWSASDPDGDALTFNVQYSPNGGTTWEMLAQNLTGNSVEIDASNVVAGQQALFRVWASDGIHTSYDQSDGVFTVPNRVPEVSIRAPADGATFAISQTVAFQGDAYDVDTGTMADDLVQWLSSIDGPLGNGCSLSVTGLSVGSHTITLQADDTMGGVASDSIQIEVVGDPAELPPVPDGLALNRRLISFQPQLGRTSARLLIENHNVEQPIAWIAVTDQSWVQLSSMSGTTPGEVSVSFLDTGLAPGMHRASITVARPDLPDEQVLVGVLVTIPGYQIYLPTILRH